MHQRRVWRNVYHDTVIYTRRGNRAEGEGASYPLEYFRKIFEGIARAICAKGEENHSKRAISHARGEKIHKCEKTEASRRLSDRERYSFRAKEKFPKSKDCGKMGKEHLLILLCRAKGKRTEDWLKSAPMNGGSYNCSYNCRASSYN